MKADELAELWSATILELDLETGDPAATYKPDAARTAPLTRRSASQVFEALRPHSFRLLSELGRGGMGVVHRAEQPALAREIALKTALPEAGDERAFIEEALVTAALPHPNVVPVYDLVASGPESVSLAMKLVSGIEWRRLLKPKNEAQRARADQTELDDHLDILLKVCDAVAFAHSRGIAHCDLKPENVMVGEFGEVLVMDWGIALDIRPELGGSEPLKATHCRSIQGPRGTPQYMAPELAEGRGDRIGPWTDVYLLGACLYELLARRPPHSGDTLAAVIMAAVKSRPPATPDGPRELAAIALKAMAAEPRKRYQGVEDFQEAIKEFRKRRESIAVTEAALEVLEGCRPATTRLTSGGPLREKERVRLHGAYAEAVASFGQARRLWAENPRALAGEQQARAEYARAALAGGDLGLAEAQIARLDSGSEDRKALRAELLATRGRLSRKARRAAVIKASAATLLVTTLASLSLGLLFVDRERRAKEKERLRAQESAAFAQARVQELGAALDITIDEVIEELDELPSPGARQARRAILMRALGFIEELQKRHDKYSVQRGRGELKLARVYDSLGDTIEARRQRESARAIFTAILAEQPENKRALAGLTAALGAITLDRLYHGDATTPESYREWLRRARELRALEPEGLESGKALLRALLSSKAEFAPGEQGVEAEPIGEALKLARSLSQLAPDDRQLQRWLIICLTQRSVLEIASGEVKAAAATRAETVRRLSRLRRDFPHDTKLLIQSTDALLDLGQIEDQLGRRRAARTHYKESLAILDRLSQADPLNNTLVKAFCRAANELGEHYQRSGEPEEAESCYAKALARARRLVELAPEAIENRRFLAAELDLVAAARRAQGRIAEARELLTESRQQYRAVFDEVGNFKSRADCAESIMRLVLIEDRPSARVETIAALKELRVHYRILAAESSPDQGLYKERLASVEKFLRSQGAQ